MSEKVSTTALAKLCGVSAKDIVIRLLDLGFIEADGEEKKLTKQGFDAGGEYRESDKFGRYIIWPSNIDLRCQNKEACNGLSGANSDCESQNRINSSKIGEKFNLSAQIINNMLSELGWIKKGLKGWCITEQGKKLNGVELTHSTSGIPYVRWPESILESNSLIETVAQFKGAEQKSSQTTESAVQDFRDKFEAKLRTTDGHFVRSKAEMIIDNWLYMAEIVHAYERKLPIEEEVYSDFYVPSGKVYIEYWGYEEDEKYLSRKQSKIEIYKKYGFNLIELSDKEVQNLDDHLPRLLLKFGVTSY